MINAKELFAEIGVRGEPALLSGGWTNEVWALGAAVLRISRTAGSEKLKREAEIGAALPAAVGYPRVLGMGVREGFEYLLLERLPGNNLEDSWSALSEKQKLGAVERMLELAELIHQTPLSAPPEPWYFDENWLESIAKYEKQGVYEEKLAARLFDIAERFKPALESCARVFCHADLTLANVMWHEDCVSAVLDFENAARAPREVDALCVIHETVFEGSPSFVKSLSDIVRPMRLDPALMIGYAAMKAQKHLSFDLENGGEQMRRLYSLAFEDGGYLRAMLG